MLLALLDHAYIISLVTSTQWNFEWDLLAFSSTLPHTLLGDMFGWLDKAHVSLDILLSSSYLDLPL